MWELERRSLDGTGPRQDRRAADVAMRFGGILYPLHWKSECGILMRSVVLNVSTMGAMGLLEEF